MVFAAVLCALPLFGVLGFEFAFAVALVASFASADLGAAFVRAARAGERRGLEHAGTPGHTVWSLWWRASVVNLALLAAPLVLVCLNGLRVRNCDWGFGFHAYFALPVLSSLCASTLGVTAATAVARPGRLSAAAPALMVFAWLMVSVYTFYAEPPVFAYNAFGGYFPGNLYDENISLGSALYASRALHLCVSAAALGLLGVVLDVPNLAVRLAPRPLGWRVRPALVAVAGLAGSAALWSQSGALGFSVTAEDIRDELGGRIATENVVLHYAASSKQIRQSAELIAEDLEFRYAQVAHQFGVPSSRPIHAYYFASAGDKRRWFGAERVHMAKPWRREIFLNHREFPHSVARHELAHVVAAEFGDPVFGVSVGRVLGLPLLFNVGLIEGAAVAADWPGNYSAPLTPHQSVVAMRRMGFEPPLASLLSAGFFRYSSSRSYTVAGSFARFLLDEYGPERFRRLYESAGDFEQSYGRPLAELAAEWRTFIDGVELPEGDGEKVRERFRRRGIFERPCPHAIARKRREAGRELNRGRRAEGLELLRDVCSDDPGEPRYILELAASLAREAGADTDAAVAMYEELASDDAMTTTVRAAALLAMADIAGRRGNLDRVLALVARGDSLQIDDNQRRQFVARAAAARHPGPGGPALRSYFWNYEPDEDPDPVVLAARAAAALHAEPSFALPHYLVGRLLYLRGGFEDAVDHLKRALELDLGHPLLTRETTRLLVIAAYRADRLDAAEQAARRLMAPDQPPMVQLLGMDWLQRITWKRHR